MASFNSQTRKTTRLMRKFPMPGKNAIVTNVRLSPETLARIDPVLLSGELRSDFIRSAIEAELKRREKTRRAAMLTPVKPAEA
jgi:hypothetical protein